MVPEYFSRIFSFSQMDFEYTIYQMISLMVSPSKVFKSISYHKQTKNIYARDDPSFFIMFAFFLAVTSLSYSLLFHSFAPVFIFKFFIYSVFFDFLAVGGSYQRMRTTKKVI